MESKEAPPSRRAEYAEVTRRAIVAAARKFFTTQGYVRTKVDEIAAEARVSPAWVYAVAGGKQGLLHALVDEWTCAPEVGEIYAAIEQSVTAEDVLDVTAAGSYRMRAEWGDVMRIVLSTAPHDETAAESLDLATKRYRDGLKVAARRLASLDALKPSASVDHATDVLWFLFGYSGYFTLVDDNGWTLEQAHDWLRATASAILLK